MATQVQFRRGTAAQHAAFTGAAGEITVDSDDNRAVVHDGSTAGGHRQAKDSEVIKQGLHLLGHWPARALRPATTDGADALATSESTTNAVNDEYLAFPDAATKYAGFRFRAPKSSDESAGFTVEIEWTEADSATAHVCRWQVEMQAQGDGDTIDSAWGAAVAVDDTGSSGTRRFALTGTVTPGGSWAEGDMIHVRIARAGGHANDTLDVAAHLLGVTLFGIINAGNDA